MRQPRSQHDDRKHHYNNCSDSFGVILHNYNVSIEF
jgi:hypothetical protein